MTTTALIIVTILVLSIVASSQKPVPDRFPIHVTRIKRLNEGCVVNAESAAVRFKLRSSVSAPCAMLSAGETYQAQKATASPDPKDETKDMSILVVYNNAKNPRRDNAVFDIDSEEAIEQK